MNQPKLTGGRLISAPLGGTKQKCEAPFDEPAGRRALKPLYPTDLNNNNIGAKRAPNQKPIRYRVTGTPRVDRMSSSPQPNTMLPHINAAFKANAPSSTPAGPTAPISMQPVYDRRNPYAPLADAPEDPPTITTGTGAGASGSSIEFPPLRKRVRDPAATCSSSAPTSPAKTPKSKKPGKSKRRRTTPAVAKPPAGSDSDADFVASDSDSDSDADYAAPPPLAKKRGASKTTKKRKSPVKIDPDNVDVYPTAAKVRATVIERARAHGHTVREVGDEHVIVHLACDLSPSAVESVVCAVRDTVRSPEMSSSRLILVDARGRARVIGADGSGASVRPDGSGSSVRPDGSGSSVRPDGSSGAAPVETERLKTAWEVVHALWPQLEPVMRMYYEEVPKVREHLASGTKEVEAMKEWLFSMTAASRCFSLPTGWADEMYIAFFGTYNLGAKDQGSASFPEHPLKANAKGDSLMNPSVNHDVKGVMAGISNGDVSLELARRKIAWIDLLPFPMHVDADAKDCLNFIKKQNLRLYVRLISAMARLHHAFFDALGGLDNVCVIAQSSIVGRSKSNNVFRHFFAEVEEHCDSNLSFGPIEKFGFKAHPCSFLTGRYPGLEGLERTDAEIAYAYALVFGEYVKINMGASAVAKDGEGYAATQANRSVQGKKRGKKCKDEGLAIFELVPDPDNPGEKITVATLHGRKLVPDPKNPGEKITVFALRARKNLSLSADRRLDRNKATSKTLAAKRDEMNRVKIVVGTVCPRCKTALKRDCLATVSILNKARKDETVTPSLRVSFYCPCKVQGNRCGKRNIVDAHDRAELYKNSEHLSDAQKSQMEISIAAWMVRAVDRFNAAGRAAADDAGEVFRPCVITDRMIKDMGPQMPGTSISTQRRRKLKKMAEESGGG